MATTIRNPIEWSVDQLLHVAQGVNATGRALGHVPATQHSPLPAVRRIGAADLREALARGFDDFAACRTDVLFLCAFYPIVGLILGRLIFGENMLVLLFPLAAGFALIGPLAAVGLIEMSRQREQGRTVGWTTAFDVLHSPSIGAIAVLGLLLLAIFLIWLFAAAMIYRFTLGPVQPASLAGFLHDVVATERGWALVGVGVGVGFLFAVLVLAISVVSFALLLDRDAGVGTAVRTSLRVVTENPATLALWGLIIAAGLVLGSLPIFLGLVVVMPVLGHATWHLYRRTVEISAVLDNPRPKA